MTRWNQGKRGRSRERPNENRCFLIIARRYPPELLIHLDGNYMIVHLCRCNIRLPAWNFLFGCEKKELKSASVSHMQSYTGTFIFLHQKTRQESSLRVSDFVKWIDFNRPFVSKKCNGGVSFQEGDSPMTFEGYNFVCLQALQMKESWKQSIFADLFLSLCWNQIHGAIRLSDAAGIAKFLLTSWGEDSSCVIATR